MKSSWLPITSSLLLTLASYSTFAGGYATPAECNVDYLRDAWAVQLAIVSGGNISPAIARYTPTYSAGLFAGGQVTSGGLDNSNATVGLFAGPRVLILPRTYFAFGIDLTGTFGKKYGQDIDSSYFVGPYVSIEYYLATHILVSAFLNPISYSYEDLSGSPSTSTTHFFSTGGLGFSYLF